MAAVDDGLERRVAWAMLAAEGWEEVAGLWMYFEGRTKVFAGGRGFDEIRVPGKEELATTTEEVGLGTWVNGTAMYYNGAEPRGTVSCGWNQHFGFGQENWMEIRG